MIDKKKLAEYVRTYSWEKDIKTFMKYRAETKIIRMKEYCISCRVFIIAKDNIAIRLAICFPSDKMPKEVISWQKEGFKSIGKAKAGVTKRICNMVEWGLIDGETLLRKKKINE